MKRSSPNHTGEKCNLPLLRQRPLVVPSTSCAEPRQLDPSIFQHGSVARKDHEKAVSATSKGCASSSLLLKTREKPVNHLTWNFERRHPCSTPGTSLRPTYSSESSPDHLRPAASSSSSSLPPLHLDSSSPFHLAEHTEERIQLANSSHRSIKLPAACMQGRFGNSQWGKPSVHLLNSLGKPRAKPTKLPHTATFCSILIRHLAPWNFEP